MLVALAVLVATDAKVDLEKTDLEKTDLAWGLIPQCTRGFQTLLDLDE